MDDLLIVRMSDRSKERYTNRRARTPMGVNLGAIAGAAVGFAMGIRLYPESPMAPMVGAIAGLLAGVAFGGIFGRILKLGRNTRRKPRVDIYDGIPFSKEENDEKEQ